MARHHGAGSWRRDSFEHPLHLRQEQALEGKYLIQVEGCDLSKRSRSTRN